MNNNELIECIEKFQKMFPKYNILMSVKTNKKLNCIEEYQGHKIIVSNLIPDDKFYIMKLETEDKPDEKIMR